MIVRLVRSAPMTAILIACLANVAVPSAALTGRDVMENVEARESGESTHALIGLRLIDRSGRVSERVIEQYGLEDENGFVRNVIIFHRPASVAGTRFLTIENENRDDDQWIYLPALQRIRRIAAGEGSSSFMGTDFSYDDLSPIDLDEYRYELVRSEELDGRPTHVVAMYPIDADSSAYSRTVHWVDTERWVPLRIEFYDEDEQLLKVNTITRLERVQGYWTAINNTMENVQTGHRTELLVQRWVYNEDLPSSLFTRRFLETGRP